MKQCYVMQAYNFCIALYVYLHFCLHFCPLSHDGFQLSLFYTVGWCSNGAKYITILNTAMLWLRQTIYLTKLSQKHNSCKTPHTSPSQVSYGVCIVNNIREYWPPLIYCCHPLYSGPNQCHCKSVIWPLLCDVMLFYRALFLALGK